MGPLTYRDHKILAQNLPMTGPSAGSAGRCLARAGPSRRPELGTILLLFDPAGGFFRPDRKPAPPARADAVKAGRTSAATPAPGRGSAFTASSTTARWCVRDEPLSSMRRSSVSTWRRQFEFPVPVPACSTESRELPSGTPSNSAISSPSNYVLLLTGHQHIIDACPVPTRVARWAEWYKPDHTI